MSPDVKIRNLSDKPLKLVLIEHFDPVQTGAFQIHNVTRSLASVTNSIGLTNATTRANVPQISPDSQPFQTREVQIDLPPFSVVQTDVKPIVKNHAKERLRLTFQTELGGRHRMYCPVPTAESHSLEALADNPRMRFTGIYLPDESFVALYESSDLERWMDRIDDKVPLGALSVPGTHNAPTCHNAPPSVRCQAVSPVEQLKNGVRFFDIRVQVPEPFDGGSDKLVLVHSVFPISLTGNKYFRDLYNECRKFLDEHPSETLIMSMKREGSGKGTDEQLGRVLKDHYTNPNQWWTRPWLPRLGEARGKIVLIRRFNLEEGLKHEWDNKGWGIDGSVWADNTPNAMCPSGDICVQDFYEVKEAPSIDQKITYCREHLERSGCCRINYDDEHAKIPLYINFLSASNFWNVGTWPEKIAAKVNPAIVAHTCTKHMLEDDGRVKEGDWSTGIVVCDWVGLDGDWDLVRCVVGMNSKLPRR
ncbi:hypothetical protein PMZ80_001438 [Knufia obscura]|uniref:Phosphatidylinositol-specific phospholipase C X domain-containing protein n=2 Tax=Knufia TaxID=430999 RepID=A0AAN8IA29_9EURO|nr:hypothetical protein PMZ80_001438 [Knufia obscura]KAK5956166.1 hypothetical protein OHC33_002739 [Knufia fluminis]